MVKRKKERPIEATFWLLFSSAGGVLFAFGLNDAIQGNTRAWISVIVGATMTFVGVSLGKYRTETSFAIKMKKK